MTYGFHFRNWVKVVLPPTAAARLTLLFKFISMLYVQKRRRFTHHVSPVLTCCSLQADGKQAALVKVQLSLFE